MNKPKVLDKIKVGYAKADITPEPGGVLSGFGFRDAPSTGIHTRLYVRTIFFKGSDSSY